MGDSRPAQGSADRAAVGIAMAAKKYVIVRNSDCHILKIPRLWLLGARFP
jgi:hypothetical protein